MTSRSHSSTEEIERPEAGDEACPPTRWGHLLSVDPPALDFRLAAWGVGSAGSAASSPTCRVTLGEASHSPRHGQGGGPLPADW